MSDDPWLAEQFEANRTRLHAVAHRVLGSAAEADDAVQETWIRLSRSDADVVDNLGGWLTTVVGRVALDMLRSRTRRRSDSADEVEPAVAVTPVEAPDEQAVLADSVGAALLLVLDTLSPNERLAFVLHDTFSVPFEQIGTILDRSADAAKQLAHRARRKVQGRDAAFGADTGRQRKVVEAFLAASRHGDFTALLSLLHPEVVLRADAVAVRMGSPEQVESADAVASVFCGRALGAATVAVDGLAGLVWRVGGRPKVVWDFEVVDGVVVAIDMIADTEVLDELGLIDLP